MTQATWSEKPDAVARAFGVDPVVGLDAAESARRLAEHGPNHSDEVTALVAGGNGGWDPQNRPNLNCAGGYCGYSGNPQTMPMTDTELRLMARAAHMGLRSTPKNG